MNLKILYKIKKDGKEGEEMQKVMFILRRMYFFSPNHFTVLLLQEFSGKKK